MVEIINKILLLLLVLSTLNVIRHLFYIIILWRKMYNDTEGKIESYKLTTKSTLILGLSISYIISTFIIGVYI